VDRHRQFESLAVSEGGQGVEPHVFTPLAQLSSLRSSGLGLTSRDAPAPLEVLAEVDLTSDQHDETGQDDKRAAVPAQGRVRASPHLWSYLGVPQRRTPSRTVAHGGDHDVPAEWWQAWVTEAGGGGHRLMRRTSAAATAETAAKETASDLEAPTR